MVSIKWIFVNPKPNPTFHVDDLMRIQTRLLRFVGMGRMDYKPYLPKYLAFLSLPINLLVFVFWAFACGHIMVLFLFEISDDLRQSNVDVKKVTDSITMIVINSFSFSVVLYFQYHSKMYDRIVDYMNQKFLFRSANAFTFVTLEKCFLRSKRFIAVWGILGLSGCLQWLLIPIITKSEELPINVKYPFDQSVSGFKNRDLGTEI